MKTLFIPTNNNTTTPSYCNHRIQEAMGLEARDPLHTPMAPPPAYDYVTKQRLCFAPHSWGSGNRTYVIHADQRDKKLKINTRHSERERPRDVTLCECYYFYSHFLRDMGYEMNPQHFQIENTGDNVHRQQDRPCKNISSNLQLNSYTPRAENHIRTMFSALKIMFSALHEGC